MKAVITWQGVRLTLTGTSSLGVMDTVIYILWTTEKLRKACETIDLKTDQVVDDKVKFILLPWMIAIPMHYPLLCDYWSKITGLPFFRNHADHVKATTETINDANRVH